MTRTIAIKYSFFIDSTSSPQTEHIVLNLVGLLHSGQFIFIFLKTFVLIFHHIV